ncbi:MAG: PPOX class F420-dependent oxidoreductase [Actinomycetota bacterium]|jgi:PPOX class probable F420-dependent enzyme
MTTEPELRDLTDDERRAFLAEGAPTAVVVTTRPDGRPHAAPVGFVTDGDDVLFLTGADTVKAANLRRDPRVTVVIDDGPPYWFVIAEGDAEIVDDAERRRDVARRTWRRYVGSEPTGDPEPAGSVLVRVRPSRIIARTHR